MIYSKVVNLNRASPENVSELEVEAVALSFVTFKFQFAYLSDGTFHALNLNNLMVSIGSVLRAALCFDRATVSDDK